MNPNAINNDNSIMNFMNINPLFYNFFKTFQFNNNKWWTENFRYF